MKKRIDPFGFKSHGVRNFFFDRCAPHPYRGIYYFLSRPATGSTFKSTDDVDNFVRQFCEHELGFKTSSRVRMARRVDKNWEYFKHCIRRT